MTNKQKVLVFYPDAGVVVGSDYQIWATPTHRTALNREVNQVCIGVGSTEELAWAQAASQVEAWTRAWAYAQSVEKMTPKPSDHICRTCFFGVFESHGIPCQMGRCFLKPPVIITNETAVDFMRPEIQKEDFCGQWKPKS